jgi:hypothetical protein
MLLGVNNPSQSSESITSNLILREDGIGYLLKGGSLTKQA